MSRITLEPEQKALEINLDNTIYGTFSEIGAGQEVARHFFQVGAAAGTIAKTMSAYDKTYSDEIYGSESTNRYVCEARLYKMLDHEYDLLDSRLDDERPDTRFFVFADTVAAINYHRTIKGNGWLGVRFQDSAHGEPNDVVLQVRMLDNNNVLQQQAVGVLGVNLIYACYKYADNIELFLKSLVDQIEDRVFVDMVRFNGPVFKNVEPRLIPLLLVKNNICDVSMFDATGNPIHGSEFLYRKEVLVVRGKYKPTTIANQDMYDKCKSQFNKEPNANPQKIEILTELSLDQLKDKEGNIDLQDYLDRTAILCALGRKVIITKNNFHPKLMDYLVDFKFSRLGLAVGVKQLLNTINKTYKDNEDDKLIAAFGTLFTRKLKVYVYPALQEGSAEVMNAKNIPIPEGITFLYKHLVDNNQIVDIKSFAPKALEVFSEDVLEMLKSDQEGWDKLVPKKAANTIRELSLFGFPVEQMEFDY